MAVPEQTKSPGDGDDGQWVKPEWARWARESDKIMLTHGRVEGGRSFKRNYQARWRAKSLVDTMVKLGLHPRWQLRTRVWKTEEGWAWSVQYLGRHGDD